MSNKYLGFGSNIGESAKTIRRAAAWLRKDSRIQSLELSPLYRTAPVGKVDQDWFVNAVARVETELGARELLSLCLECERAFKRERLERWGPRTLDIDVLLCGEERIEEEGLEVPHPRMAERAFVLAPLAALDAELRVNGERVGDLLAKLKGQELEVLPEVVAVIGASEKEDRYANMAQRMLMEHGYGTLPVSPLGKTILGVAGVTDLEECRETVDTVTLYVGSARVESVVDSIIEAMPRRVIFNPGTENAAARERLESAGIETIEACTLVMLRTGQW